MVFRTGTEYPNRNIIDGYDIFGNLVDGVDIIYVENPLSLADSIVKTQKTLVDGYAFTTMLPRYAGISLEEGQTFIYDSITETMKPGASGDSSFKLQSVSTPNAIVKAGFLILDDGRELQVASDITVNLTTILGTSPSDATSYYLYIDLYKLPSSTLTTSGRAVYLISQTQLYLSTTLPTSINLSSSVPLAVIKTATSGNAWSGTGSSFESLAFRRHSKSASASINPVIFSTSFTGATAPTTITHNKNILPENQQWLATQTKISDGYQVTLDSSWQVNLTSNTATVNFLPLASGDIVELKLMDIGISVGTIPIKNYDSGPVLANTITLPTNHNLGGIPTALVLTQEISSGEWEPLDFGAFLSVTNSQIKGDLSSLGSQKIRIIASVGQEAVVSNMYRTMIVTSDVTAIAGDELMVNTSSPRIVTLPASPTLGQRVKVVDYVGLSNTNNITVNRNGNNIEGAASNFTINAARAWVEFIYVDSTQGWITIG